MSTFKTFKRLKNDRRGVTALEYGLIAALIAGAIVAGAGTVGTQASTVFSKLGATMTTAANKITTP